MKNQKISLLTDPTVMDHCEDSAHSAPPNFNFDTGILNDTQDDCPGDLLSQAMNVVITGNTIVESEGVNGINEGQRFLNSVLIPSVNHPTDLLTSSLLHSPEKETVQFEPVNDQLISGKIEVVYDVSVRRDFNPYRPGTDNCRYRTVIHN